MAGQTIQVSVLADTKGFKSALNDLGDTTGLSKLGDGIKNVGKLMAVGVAAVAAGAVAWAGDTARAMAEVERISAQTANVLKSTGGASEKTQDQIEALANSIEGMTGVEAEAVQEGQNMLLTFTGIKGANFDRATSTMTDMAVAMNNGSLAGVDMQSTAIQLGKALNDPLQGMTALSKVGVSFTDAQKDQIKTMQEAGDVAGAQTVILDELAKEFGGAAEAAGGTPLGKWAKIQNTFGNIGEQIFGFLMPALATISDWALNKGLPMLSQLGPAVEAMAGAFKRGGSDVEGSGLAGAFERVGLFARQVYDRFNDDVLPVLRELGAWITGTLVPALVSFGAGLVAAGRWAQENADWLGALAVAIGTLVVGYQGYVKVMAIWQAATKVAMAVQAAYNAVMSANPIGIIILAVAALVAGLVYFFTQTDTGREIVAKAWAGIQDAIAAVTGWWTGTAQPAIVAGWDAVVGAFETGKAKVTGFMNGVWDVIKAVWSFSPLGMIVTNWDAITGFFSAIPGRVRGFMDSAVGFIRTAFSYSPIGLVVNNWDAIMGFFSAIPDRVRGLFSGAGSWLVNAGRNIIEGLIEGAGGLLSKLGTFFLDKVPAFIKEPFKQALGIRSPSRWFAARGADSVAGYVNDVRSRLGALRVSSRAMATAVTDGFTPTLTAPEVQLGGVNARAGAGAGNVTIQVYALQDGPEVGRRVHEALENFYRLNGRRP